MQGDFDDPTLDEEEIDKIIGTPEVLEDAGIKPEDVDEFSSEVSLDPYGVQIDWGEED